VIDAQKEVVLSSLLKFLEALQLPSVQITASQGDMRMIVEAKKELEYQGRKLKELQS
jgi:hypothetical protein